MDLKRNEALLNYSRIICIASPVASKSSFELFVKSEGPFQSLFTTQQELERGGGVGIYPGGGGGPN